MAAKLSFERYLWFHSKLKRGLYPSKRGLADKFEISLRQASREIEFMRNFFGAPIEYSTDYEGYFYSDTSFEMPGIWISEEEMVSLVISRAIASSIPDESIKDKVNNLLSKLYTHFGINLSDLENKISIKNIQFDKVDEQVFSFVIWGLVNRKKLEIEYRSPHKQEQSRRVVNPLHILLYLGNWHLIAFCEKRQKIRNFVLSRIINVEMIDEPLSDEVSDIDIKNQVHRSYGIFFEGRKTDVTLRFSAEVSERVKYQIWSSEQKISSDKDGSLLISFPVSDYREITGDILRYGSSVEVLEPEELRNEIKQTVSDLKQIYKA